MRRRLMIALLVCAGCDGMVERDDGGGEPPDAGSTPTDAGDVPDAGSPDAGRDAGMTVPDAGRADDGGITPYDAGVIPDAGPTNLRQTPHVIGSTDAGNGFYEYLPPGYGDGASRPLLVFWHGIGENGNADGGLTELQAVLANGPPKKLISQNRWSNGWPFVVLSPQHRGGGCPSSGEIDAFIKWGAAHYAVDARRLYLTGLSCGAIGSWSYVGDHLDTTIAAAVLIAGDPGDPTQSYSVWGRNMCNLGRLPIWSFHGDADPTVNIGHDQDTMARLLACPAPPRVDDRFTVYPGVGHDSWSRTYDLSAGHDVYSWLLQQTKP